MSQPKHALSKFQDVDSLRLFGFNGGEVVFAKNVKKRFSKVLGKPFLYI